MLVLITYDVAVSSSNGAKRLRQISKQCINYGRRVQNSVFECHVDNATFIMLKKKLLDIMDENEDSIRFYLLGNKFQGKVEHYGIKESYDPDKLLMI